METYYEFIIGALAMYSTMAAWQLYKVNSTGKKFRRRFEKTRQPEYEIPEI